MADRKRGLVHPCVRVIDMLEKADEEIDFNGKRDVYPDAQITYWVVGIPMAHHHYRNETGNRADV